MNIPSELKSVIEDSGFAALATHDSKIEIQNHLMWIDYEEDRFLINTEQGRRKTENIRLDDSLTLLIFHPNQMYRSWEVRGVVEEVKVGQSANDHIDKLSERYLNKPYKRETGITWSSAGIKNRELWVINANKIISMSSIASQPISE